MRAKNLTPSAELSVAYNKIERADVLVVRVVWTGRKLDRPSIESFHFERTEGGLRTALRVIRAVNAGKFYSNPKVVRDVARQTYVKATSILTERSIGASLKKIGY